YGIFGNVSIPGVLMPTPLPRSPFGAFVMRTCQSSVTTAVQYPVRSIGARDFAVGGEPPRCPPRACAKTGAAIQESRTIVRANLVHGLTGAASPRFAVGRARNLYQPRTGAARTACGIRNDLDRITDFESILIHALLRKLGRSGSFDRP